LQVADLKPRDLREPCAGHRRDFGHEAKRAVALIGGRRSTVAVLGLGAALPSLPPAVADASASLDPCSEFLAARS